MSGPWPRTSLALAVVIFAFAMAYLESAVVVYLREALGVGTGDVFPIDLESELSGRLGWIEVGREAATLLMIGGAGWIAGRAGLERLAWAAVVFGVWDIGWSCGSAFLRRMNAPKSSSSLGANPGMRAGRIARSSSLYGSGRPSRIAATSSSRRGVRVPSARPCHAGTKRARTRPYFVVSWNNASS